MTNNFKSSEKYGDDKYKFFNLNDGNRDLRRITCDSDGICIIPFDTNGEKLTYVYLARYIDYLNDQHGHTCISVDAKRDNSFDSNFEEIHSIIQGELNIDADVNNIYYIGKIKHTLPFTKVYRCYAVKLDDYSKDPSGFTIDISDKERKSKLYSLDKIKFSRLINGDIEDSLAMSATLLLLSYIN